jgi:hypothetical protein
MKVMTSGPGGNKLPRSILAFFYFYFFLHWVTSILMFREKLGFSYPGVVRYYVGDPEFFMQPRSFPGLLEVTHFHLFAMGIFFVVFTHLLLFTSWSEAIKRLLILLLAFSLVGDIASGWLIRYLADGFAWLKLFSFWILQGTSLVLLVGLTTDLFRSRGRANNQLKI